MKFPVRVIQPAAGSCARLSGFTLIEVIITLTVGALLMAVILPYLGTSLTRSSEPLANLQDTLLLYQTMENMTADYRDQKVGGSIDLTAFQNKISELGGEGIDIHNAYGDYHVLENRFILFDTVDRETAADETQKYILKVTIRPIASGAAFTTLFTDGLP